MEKRRINENGLPDPGRPATFHNMGRTNSPRRSAFML